MFGQKSAFGAPAASSGFGASSFGAPGTSQSFGGAAGGGAFGTTAAPAFGQAATSSAFGAPTAQAGGLFSAGGQQPQAGAAGGLFGQPAASTSFGGGATAANAFGGGTAATGFGATAFKQTRRRHRVWRHDDRIRRSPRRPPPAVDSSAHPLLLQPGCLEANNSLKLRLSGWRVPAVPSGPPPPLSVNNSKGRSVRLSNSTLPRVRTP